MKKIKNIYLVLFASVALNTVNAQDVHFSQMSASPLTLNPALAGANASMTGIVNYRTQWKSIASPFQTIAASFDMRTNESNRYKRGTLGVGFNFYNDRSGDAKLTNTTANFNLAYHLILNRNSTIGGGIYGSYGQRSIDPLSGRWGSQYNGMQYDPLLSSGELFETVNYSYADVGTGFLYAYKQDERNMRGNDEKELNIGFAVYHLNKPKYTFLSENDERLSMRFSGFINAKIGIANSNMSLMPAIYYQRQNTAQEILFGTYFRSMLRGESKVTGFNKGTFASLGTFYRFGDSFIVKGMLEWSEFSCGMAYDLNISGLTKASSGRGGFEVFLKYMVNRSLMGKRVKI